MRIAKFGLQIEQSEHALLKMSPMRKLRNRAQVHIQPFIEERVVILRVAEKARPVLERMRQ